MADLISRAVLLNDLSYCAPELWHDEEYIEAKIMKQPAVDAVPVVRCKDCWKRGLDNCPMEFYWDSHPADDLCYCAMGEPKGE